MKSFELVMDAETTKKTYKGMSRKVIASIKDKKFLIKEGDFYEVFVEYYASKLGKMLGLKINDVGMTSDGNVFGLSKFCSVHLFEERFVEYRNVARSLTDSERIVLNIFDQIINNTDRHGGNYGFVNDKLFIIDNGLGVPWEANFHEKTLREAAKSKEKEVVKLIKKFMNLDMVKVEKILRKTERYSNEFQEGKIKRVLTRIYRMKSFIKAEQESIQLIA